MREPSYPKITTLCVGASVIILKNIIVGWKIMNRCIVIIRQIVYHHHNGPTHDLSCHPAYTTVESHQSTIPVNTNHFPDRPSTWVHIPAVIERCERKCCNISTILLRVYIVITVHKSQGMTIGLNQIFEHVVIRLPSGTMKKTPGIYFLLCQ